MMGLSQVRCLSGSSGIESVPLRDVHIPLACSSILESKVSSPGNICLASVAEAASDEKYAGISISAAFHIPRPPLFTGNAACFHVEISLRKFFSQARKQCSHYSNQLILCMCIVYKINIHNSYLGGVPSIFLEKNGILYFSIIVRDFCRASF